MLYGIYPEVELAPIDEYLMASFDKQPMVVKGLINQLSVRQLVRFVVRLENTVEEQKTKKQLISRVQEIRPIVVTTSITKTGRVSLTEVLDRVEDVPYLVQQWIEQKDLSSSLSFTFSDLVSAYIERHPSQSSAYFNKLPVEIHRAIERLLDVSTKEKLDQVLGKTEKEKQKEKGALKKVDSEKSDDFDEPAEPLYINNAGLVVLYPFLSRFFKMLDLLSEDKKSFVDETAAHRAVHLLHYLVYGKEDGKEFQMTINKIICGMPFGVPLKKEIKLTDKEIETCDSLLNGVIQNWKILGKSSIENLRGSFLIRDGRLEMSEKAWFLKVEQRGYDMLIDKIPWSFQMIKLPWMKKPIHVEWR
ncbi:hypothetical protein E1176_00810 [Fulvivirga sp. RKSG066]|nr:hypothetical protein [Fulvivirga aurantia]